MARGRKAARYPSHNGVVALKALRSAAGEVCEVSLPELPGLVRLPQVAGADVQAGEPAVAVDPGVQADGPAAIEGQAALLAGVAADHDFAALVRRAGCSARGRS